MAKIDVKELRTSLAPECGRVVEIDLDLEHISQIELSEINPARAGVKCGYPSIR